MIFQWWQILLPYLGCWYCPELLLLDLADVVPIDNGMSLLMAYVIAIICLMADVNAIGGWWNATDFYVVDVITTWFSLADVIAICVMWQMLLPLGRCYSQ